MICSIEKHCESTFISSSLHITHFLSFQPHSFLPLPFFNFKSLPSESSHSAKLQRHKFGTNLWKWRAEGPRCHEVQRDASVFAVGAAAEIARSAGTRLPCWDACGRNATPLPWRSACCRVRREMPLLAKMKRVKSERNSEEEIQNYTAAPCIFCQKVKKSEDEKRNRTFLNGVASSGGHQFSHVHVYHNIKYTTYIKCIT